MSYDEPIDGYHVYRRRASEAAEARITRDLIPVGARRYVDETVAAGVQYYYSLAAVRPDGSEIRSPMTSVRTMPLGVALYQNHPNPFNPTTTIRFTLPEAQHVAVGIFNARGEHVIELVNEIRSEGDHEVIWNGRDVAGRLVGSGVYFYQLRTSDATQTRKMILLK